MNFTILERFNNRFKKIENHTFINETELTKSMKGNTIYENHENWIPSTIDRNLLDSYILHFRILIQKKMVYHFIIFLIFIKRLIQILMNLKKKWEKLKTY